MVVMVLVILAIQIHFHLTVTRVLILATIGFLSVVVEDDDAPFRERYIYKCARCRGIRNYVHGTIVSLCRVFDPGRRLWISILKHSTN